MKLSRVSTLLTCVAMAGFLLVCGASLFEHTALASSWAKDPPASLQMFRGDYPVAPQNFFKVAHTILAPVLLGALVVSWKNRERRRLLIIVCAGYMAALIATGVYFVPELKGILMGAEAISNNEQRSRALAWEKLALARTIWMLLFAIPLMAATRAEASARPRSEND